MMGCDELHKTQRKTTPQSAESAVPMSRIVEVVDGIHTDSQSVEKNPSSNKVEQVVTNILVHWDPVRVCVQIT